MAGSTAAPRRLRTYTRPRVSLLYVLRRTLHRLLELQVWDVAAAMTFFGALSLLPTVVALLSVVSLLGVEEETVDAAAHLAAEIWPSLTPDVVREWILTLGSAGPGTGAVVLGAVGTVVSASGAVGAFHRAMHRIHDTREGRPFLHFRLVVFVETLALMLGAVLITILVVVGGDLSLRLGQAVGLPEETVQTWNVVKWPVILVVIALIVTLAYRLGPNVRQPRYRPLSLGAVAVVALLFGATMALGWITDRFGQFAVVGRINSAIGVLALAWVACIVLLAGAAFDAEVLRARQLAVGIDASVEIQLATRHTAVLEESERHEARNRRLARLVADAVRAGEDLTIEATPLLSEEGRLLAVESGQRGPEDVSSGRPFHADPVSDDGARLEPTPRPDD
ncbi:YihY/virulence factor BrkB family protein [Micrococcus luteus]|uniref:YihY/virulence factor BrkB family protein n=1 Tax=Micrococcus luteus TaxID=1270 RepID=UPI0036C02458